MHTTHTYSARLTFFTCFCYVLLFNFFEWGIEKNLLQEVFFSVTLCAGACVCVSDWHVVNVSCFVCVIFCKSEYNIHERPPQFHHAWTHSPSAENFYKTKKGIMQRYNVLSLTSSSSLPSSSFFMQSNET